MAKTIFNFESLGKDYSKMVKEIRAGNSCSIFGIQNSMRPALCNSFGKKILFVTADNITASVKQEEFELMGLKACFFPAVQDGFVFKRAGSNEFNLARTLTLKNIITKNFDVIVAPINSLFSFLPSVKEFKEHVLKFKINQELTIEKLERLLRDAGYKKEELISAEGQFSRRGEIVDVFPIGEKNPFRIDFFDTIIESIKIFDIATQKGTKPMHEISICPNTNLFLDVDEIDEIKHNLAKLKKEAVTEGSEELIFNNFIDGHKILQRFLTNLENLLH